MEAHNGILPDRPEGICIDAMGVVSDVCLQVGYILNPPALNNILQVPQSDKPRWSKSGERGGHVVEKGRLVILSSPKLEISSCFTGVALYRGAPYSMNIVRSTR